MKQGLHVNLSQQLTMTPALQQAIRLLQLPTQELQQEIQRALDENIMLELDESGSDDAAAFESAEFISSQELTTSHPDTGSDTAIESIEPVDLQNQNTLNFDSTDDTGQNANIASEYPESTTSSVDPDGENLAAEASSYDAELSNNETYTSSGTPNSSAENLHDTALNLVGAVGLDDDLHNYLHWQLDMSTCSDIDRLIADYIIDSIDEHGYLTASAQDIATEINDADPLQEPTEHHQNTSTNKSKSELTAEDIEPVIHRIQSYDPSGVGARNLQECLQLQLRHYVENQRLQSSDHEINSHEADSHQTNSTEKQQLPTDDIAHLSKRILDDHFNALAKHDIASIKRRTKRSDQEITAAICLIQRFNPRPGNAITSNRTESITPDVYVRKVLDPKTRQYEWQALLNLEHIPKIQVNEFYVQLNKTIQDPEQKKITRDHLSEARWLVKNLENRNSTLITVANMIVAKQQNYFNHGVEHLQPMVLREIADSVGMHNSTISRITSNKYMDTPHGVVPFKFFFSSQIDTQSGGAASSTAIQAQIKKLINQENSKKPLSDSKLSALLNEEGIKIARRTVAKYREALAIPPSSERKHLT